MKRAAAAYGVALCALLGSGVASAGLFRAYLSANGSDANPCTLQKPCRLLPAALAAVNDGGEVWILDSANYNTGQVNVTQSVTILAVPGALASMVAAPSAVALNVNASGTSVTLRNLNVRDLNGQNANTGIRLQAGASLRIETCEIYGVAFGIVLETAGATATIVNTAIHDTEVGLITIDANHVSMDGLSASNNNVAVQAVNGAHVTLSNSNLAANGLAIRADSGGGTFTVVDVARSTVSATAAGSVGFTVSAGSGNVAEIFVHSTTVHVDTGFSFDGLGGSETIYSFGDNQVIIYSALVKGPGSLTPISKL